MSPVLARSNTSSTKVIAPLYQITIFNVQHGTSRDAVGAGNSQGNMCIANLGDLTGLFQVIPGATSFPATTRSPTSTVGCCPCRSSCVGHWSAPPKCGEWLHPFANTPNFTFFFTLNFGAGNDCTGFNLLTFFHQNSGQGAALGLISNTSRRMIIVSRITSCRRITSGSFSSGTCSISASHGRILPQFPALVESAAVLALQLT
jgi:hypothetical protein